MENSIRVKETDKRGIAYTEEFKSLIRENPGIIASLRRAEAQFSDMKKGDIFEDGNLKIELIYGFELKNDIDYLKVTIDDKIFFVKRIPGLWSVGKGVDEFKSLQNAKEKLKDVEDVEVIEYCLGYQDDNSTYFVSKWVDLPLLDDYIVHIKSQYYIGNLSKEDMDKEIDYINKREFIIHKILSGFSDTGSHNYFYDPKSKKIIIFDIHYF